MVANLTWNVQGYFLSLYIPSNVNGHRLSWRNNVNVFDFGVLKHILYYIIFLKFEKFRIFKHILC
jgi:hypothetical protein